MKATMAMFLDNLLPFELATQLALKICTLIITLVTTSVIEQLASLYQTCIVASFRHIEMN